MPAVGLNPFDHPVDFNELRLPDLVSFFTYISEMLAEYGAMDAMEPLPQDTVGRGLDMEVAVEIDEHQP